MSSDVSAETPPVEYDPVFVHSRREALIIFCVWALALLWSVPFCYYNGFLSLSILGTEYTRSFDPESFDTILGMPAWVFGGIVLPWLAADVFTVWFCFFYMKEDDLGEANEDADLREEIAEMHAADRDAVSQKEGQP